MMQRMGMMIGLKPEHKEEYIRVHADVWPEVLERLRQSNITNYSIFLREPENLMFAYWEYTGSDFEADSARIAADPVTQDWWKLCGPMQSPLESRSEGEWWAGMEEVFHLD
jgi:L-rhamnose mutarotase